MKTEAKPFVMEKARLLKYAIAIYFSQLCCWNIDRESDALIPVKNNGVPVLLTYSIANSICFVLWWEERASMML